MESSDRIAEMLNMVTEGIDPSTGEIIDAEELKKDPVFQEALKRLSRRYRTVSSGSVYAQFEEAFPYHAIVMTEGYFYAVHNKSAFVLNELLGYKVVLDFFSRPTTGGPDYEKISSIFKSEGISYVLISKGALVEQYDGINPFEKFGIDEEACRNFVSEAMSQFSSSDTGHLRPSLGNSAARSHDYPYNLLNILIPDVTVFPEDIENRVLEVLDSTSVFSKQYRRDAKCVQSYYRDGLTLEEIGDNYGLTRERIRQLVKRGIKKMQRTVVCSYLKGESDVLEIPGVTKIAPNTSGNAVVADFEDCPQASDDAMSISALARLLSASESMPEGAKVQYGDISSWLISVGDLSRIEDASASLLIPTEQGEEKGIKRGKRTNSHGMKYTGVFLEPPAQEYIRRNIDQILANKNSNDDE